MESPTTEDEAMTDIAARLERATRSALASSSLASYSFSRSSSARGHLSQLPSLADLLPHLGSTDAPRCPSCRASLPFGPRSHLCLACAAPFLEPSAPSFTTTLAYQRFSEALHIDGLETDFGEAGEEHLSDPDVDFASKTSSSSFSLPLELDKQKVLLHENVSSYQGTPYIEPKAVKADVQTPLPHTSTSGIMPVTMGLADVGEEKHVSILDYSAKLEGISLEDFFSNQVKPQAPAQSSDSELIPESTCTIPPGTTVHKDSAFWDPLSNFIIPDGFDLMASTDVTSMNEVVALDKVVGVEDDDPFSSWEGEFQSAAPAMSVVSTALSSFSFEPQLSAEPVASGNFGDLFGNFSNMKKRTVGESVKVQGNNGLVNNGDDLGLDTDTQKSLKTDTQRSSDVDSLFGSGWQVNVLPFMVPTTSDNQGSMKQSSLLESSKDDLVGSVSSQLMGSPMGNDNSFAFELTSTATNDNKILLEQQTSSSAGKKNKVVGSLLAQLPDLSFLLADRLVMKTEGQRTNPDTSR